MANSPYGHERIRVVVRTRPTSDFAHDMIYIEENGKIVNVHLPKNSDHIHGFINNQQLNWSFKMDKVLHNVSQEEVYSYCGSPLIPHVLDGYNATIMAFGQTGAGKTYTITGSSTNYGLRGIIPRALAQLFKEIGERHESTVVVRATYLEIYNDNIRDLLCTLPESPGDMFIDKPKDGGLSVSEDKNGYVFVKGLTVRLARNEEDALNLLFEGELNRSIAEHSLNSHSSRSHCIFTLYIESKSRTLSSAKYTVSKLTFVDLAGSERLSKTEILGNMEREAMYINTSLSFIEQVILALTERNREHIPYRQCKLTHLLKDSIGGNCTTVMIANIWVEPCQIEETMSTLKFATRMMRISNSPAKNLFQDPQLLIKEYEEEIKALRMELAIHDTLVGKTAVSYEPLAEAEIQDIDRQIRLYTSGALSELEVRSIRQVKETFSRFKVFVNSLEQLPVQTPPTPVIPQETPHAKRTSNMGSRSKSTRSQHKQPSTAATSESETEPVIVNEVGESDGVGLGLGVAPPENRLVASPVSAIKKSTIKTTASTTFAIKNKESKHSITPKDEVKVALDSKDEGRSSTQSFSEEVEQTPPSKEEEFNKFKKGRGQKIHENFLNNKEQFHKIKRECVELAAKINQLKRLIDEEQEYLEMRKKEREQKNISLLTTESGEIILDEEEFRALTHLKQLKSEYRREYDSLELAQSRLKTINHYVEKSRSTLLSAFEEWYRISYIGGECGDEKDEIKGDRGRKHMETETERFERLQSAFLKKDQSTTAFYHAKLRTERRNFSQKQGRKVGELVCTVRNKPPGVLSFS